jgi:hypothetical protein
MLVCWFVGLLACWIVCLFVCLFDCLFACLFVCLFVLAFVCEMMSACHDMTGSLDLCCRFLLERLLAAFDSICPEAEPQTCAVFGAGAADLSGR